MSPQDSSATLKSGVETPAAKPDVQQQTSVYVYESAVRLWHWINAFAILALCVTGYLIASPPSSTWGDASENYQMGYMRFVHFTAGYILAISFLFRIAWAFMGNEHSRQLFSFPYLRKSYWEEVWFEVQWYLFMVVRPRKYVGHNPLAQLFQFWFVVLGTSFMIITGFALYGEGTLAGSWAETLFGWVLPLLGGSMQVHTLHHLGMWWIIGFVIIHIYVAIREDIMSRQSLVSTMISGWRTFKDNDPD